MRQVWDPQGNSALVSQLRNIRREVATLLDARVGTQHGRVVLVTSALPNEGKSFLSLGLARVLSSEKDRRAVLVDADAPKHRLTDWLGTSGQPGLVDCLAGERTVADVLCPTDDAGLSFLPAGRWRDEAPELISSPKVDSIFGAFRRCDGRHVFVVDTAPVLAVGETIYLAARADLVVLVVRADQTPRAAVDEAIRKLAADRPLAIVLNGQQSSALEDYYGYRDYYGAYLPEREG
jgi:Mrp family chromosome partitioning ATPase